MSDLREVLVKGYVVNSDNSPIVAGKLKFNITSEVGFTDQSAVTNQEFLVVTDEEGYYEVTVWASQDSRNLTYGEVTFPKISGGDSDPEKTYRFHLAYTEDEVWLNDPIYEYLPDDELSLVSLTQKIDARTLITAVRFDIEQDLSNDEKLQARTNLGVTPELIEAKQVFINAGGAGTIAAGTTQYMSVGNHGGNNAPNASETARQSVIPAAGTLSQFYVRTSTTQPADGSLTLVIKIEGIDTPIEIVIPANSPAGIYSDLTHTAAVLINERIAVKCVNASASASATFASLAIMLQRP